MKTSKSIKAPSSFHSLNAEAVCAIIKQCGHSGVRELSFQGLKLSFGPLAQVPDIAPIHVPYDIQVQTDSQAREAIAKREQQIKDDLIQTLLVEDPEGYEQLLKDEELVDDFEE